MSLLNTNAMGEFSTLGQPGEVLLEGKRILRF